MIDRPLEIGVGHDVAQAIVGVKDESRATPFRPHAVVQCCHLLIKVLTPTQSSGMVTLVTSTVRPVTRPTGSMSQGRTTVPSPPICAELPLLTVQGYAAQACSESLLASNAPQSLMS